MDDLDALLTSAGKGSPLLRAHVLNWAHPDNPSNLPISRSILLHIFAQSLLLCNIFTGFRKYNMNVFRGLLFRLPHSQKQCDLTNVFVLNFLLISYTTNNQGKKCPEIINQYMQLYIRCSIYHIFIYTHVHWSGIMLNIFIYYFIKSCQ